MGIAAGEIGAPAVDFTREFYRALATGEPAEIALASARHVVARLHGTRQAYTVETPLWDEFADRVSVHRKAVTAFLRGVERERDPRGTLSR